MDTRSDRETGVVANSVNNETNLPEVMASLEMLTVDVNSPSKVVSKRLLRKRIPRKDVPVVMNRRCNTKPRKRGHSEMESDSEIREYYLDKKLKLSPKKLETILEERKGNGESSIYIGAKKFKRMLEFQPTAAKMRRRRAKVKKVFGSHMSRGKYTMQALLDKLSSMQTESSPEFDTEEK